jgi:hypothetical protein
MRRPLAKTSVLAACIAFAIAGLPGVALAQQPTLSAVAGQPFNASGLGGELLDGTCSGLRDVLINWRDGSQPSPPNSAGLNDAGTIDVGGSPVPVQRVSVAVSHVFPIPGLSQLTMSYSVTCINASNQPYDFHETSDPLFTVRVMGSGTAPPPDSCPPAQTTSFVRISQASCPIQYTPALGKAEKKIFRQLAGIAYKGYVVDKAIDDVVSFPGKVVSEGFFGKNAAADLVIGKFWGDYLERLVAGKGAKGLFGKATPYGWILNAPKYASYLDYVKYAVLTRLADDPPDPNFTALASPPKLRRLRGAPRQVGQRDRREAALYIALLTTVERAAGAEAAGATAAQSAQLRHASGIANQLVSLLGEKQKALKAAARTLKRIPAGRLPRSVVRRAKRRLGSRSLTPSLRKLGFTRDEIAEVRQSAPSVPLKSLTAPFEKVLGLGAEARTVGAERAALAKFAKRHAAGR